MRKILLIDDEPLVCDVVTACLKEWRGTQVDCALNGTIGAQKIRGEHFDLALIDGILPDMPGVELAAIAANENTPVVFMSGDPDTNSRLSKFGFVHLEKPFTLSRLMWESQRAIAQAQENIALIKASVARMHANAEALKATIAESCDLVDKINREKGTR